MKRKVNARSLARWFAPRPGEVLVEREWACPHCGERRMDWLANDDDTITCGTCGKVYRI